MRSLFITRWGPHRTDGGAPLRNAQNIRALATLGPVDVLSIGGQDEEVGPVPGIADWVHFPRQERRRIPGAWLAPGRHPLIDRHMHKKALAYIRALAPGRYDIAVVEEIALAGYVEPLRAVGIKTVFDAHNVEARLRADIDRASAADGPVDRLRQRVQDARLRGIEARAVRAADLVWACSRLDADLIRDLYHPKSQVAVVPNAVNIIGYAAARTAQSAAAQDAAPLLLYIGTYSYHPNEAAALRLATTILSALRARGTELRLALVGREPTAAMQMAAERDPAITVTGAVDSILPYLSQPNIVVLPITLGSGTRLKILEAFAGSCPVVSTAKGAEGIEIRSGENIVIAESDADFVTAIERLARNPAVRRTLGEGGYDTVARLYSWETAAESIRDSLGLPQSVSAWNGSDFM